MKKSAFTLLATLLCSTTALSYDGAPIWPSSDSSSSEEEVPSPSLAAIKRVRRELNLLRINFIFSDEDIAEQLEQYPSIVPFGDAAVMAMKSFLEDSSDEESLLFLIIEDVGENASTKYMQNLMTNGKATLRLVTRESEFLPIHGEDLSKYWIFHLSLGNSVLSDHTFWAMVARNGQEATMNYGFN